MVDRRAFVVSSVCGAAGVLCPAPVSSEGSRSPALTGSGVALALGGGGARGLAHIPVLEAFDDLGVKPKAIAGTSMGSLIGACYANGMKGSDIRSFAIELFENRSVLIKRLVSAPAASWTAIFKLSNAAIIEADKLFELVLPNSLPDKIEKLSIPLLIVTTDYLAQSEVVLRSGPLLPALGASCALPALLAPVRHEGRLLIDGGFVNPTPFDVVTNHAKHIVAVDLTGRQDDADAQKPNAIELTIAATQIALHNIVQAKRLNSSPSVLLSPAVAQFHTLDFYKAKEILEAAEPIKEQVKREITRLL